MIIRSAATRQHYIQIYQAIKYLSLDVADFLEKGPQLAELPDVYSELTPCRHNTNRYAALQAFAIFTFTLCST